MLVNLAKRYEEKFERNLDLVWWMEVIHIAIRRDHS
jgi:hypothetical protein